jgi:7,8-dihydropterin-6-yl-methyl-4-(beta-D-ribofuranosyl)aminobenzene 5'-phosphate synthase
MKMTTGSCAALLSRLVLVLAVSSLNNSAASAQVSPAKAQITILYDAFGQNSEMHKDWGYAALIEYGGKRILFDTGNNPDILVLRMRKSRELT